MSEPRNRAPNCPVSWKRKWVQDTRNDPHRRLMVHWMRKLCHAIRTRPLSECRPLLDRVERLARREYEPKVS